MDTGLSEKTTRKALEYIYKMSFLGIGGHFLVVCIVAFLFYGVVAEDLIACGVMAHVIILAGRALTVARYLRVRASIQTPRSVGRWIAYYQVGVAASGTAWGLAIIPLQQISGPEYHFLLLSILIGLAGAGLTTLGVLFRVYAAYMFPMLGIAGTWMLFQDASIYNITVLLIALTILYFAMTAYRFSLNFSQLLYEKENALRSQLEIVQHLSMAAEYRDNETGMHIERMSHACYLLAKAYGFDEDAARMLLHASSMHDIGKIGISDDILLKPGKLTDEEMSVMQTHTLIGKRILEASDSNVIQLAERIAVSHHEKYDGSGYPYGLRGDAIPIEGRITAICDVFDALTSNRPYKQAWSVADALRYLEEQSGKHFDPHLVGLFVRIVPEVCAFQQSHQDD